MSILILRSLIRYTFVIKHAIFDISSFNILLIYKIRTIYLLVIIIRFSSSRTNIDKTIFLISTSKIIYSIYFLLSNITK